MIDGFFEREEIDSLSSAEVFEKTKGGLEGAVGQLILLVKPEDSGGRYDSFSVEEYTTRVSSFGVLAGVPTMGDPLSKDVFHDVVLPVDRYVHGFHDIKDGPMRFNCIDKGNLGISDSDILKNRVSIYVGALVIEGIMAGHVIDYFMGMNRLGGSVSDEFYSRHGDEIEARKCLVLDNLRQQIIAELPDSVSSDRGEWKKIYDYVLGLGVESQPLKLGEGVSLDASIGEYVRSKL